MPDWAVIVGAVWLGVLTSISPCPLATNVAAVAFLARRAERRRAVAWSGLAYTAGRMAAYSALAIGITRGMLSVPGAAEFLRLKMAGLPGPVLILVGMLVAGWLPVRFPGMGGINALGSRLAARGMAGEFLMGAVFALAFCPVSAALFFGGLVPAILKTGAALSLAFAYGIGTAVPVAIAALVFACGMATEKLRKIGDLGGRLQQGTAWILIVAGVWLTIRGLAG